MKKFGIIIIFLTTFLIIFTKCSNSSRIEEIPLSKFIKAYTKSFNKIYSNRKSDKEYLKNKQEFISKYFADSTVTINKDFYSFISNINLSKSDSSLFRRESLSVNSFLDLLNDNNVVSIRLKLLSPLKRKFVYNKLDSVNTKQANYLFEGVILLDTETNKIKDTISAYMKFVNINDSDSISNWKISSMSSNITETIIPEEAITDTTILPIDSIIETNSDSLIRLSAQMKTKTTIRLINAFNDSINNNEQKERILDIVSQLFTPNGYIILSNSTKNEYLKFSLPVFFQRMEIMPKTQFDFLDVTTTEINNAELIDDKLYADIITLHDVSSFDATGYPVCNKETSVRATINDTTLINCQMIYKLVLIEKLKEKK